jgi:hypothetical protein
MMKLSGKFCSLVVAGATGLFLALPVAAESQEEFQELCMEFPLNTRCKDFVAPIALEQRPGVPTNSCVIKMAQDEIKGACKVAFLPDQVLIYHEVGPTLSLLKQQRTTQVLTIPVAAVGHIQYREVRRVAVARSLLNLFNGGIIGAALTPKDKTLEFSINYKLDSAPTETTQASSTGKPELTQLAAKDPTPLNPPAKPSEVDKAIAAATDEKLDKVVFFLNPKVGFEVRTQLETMLGKPLETPE